MCYSAEASFGSGALLLGAGAWCARTAARKSPWFWPFAVVPVLFGVQQCTEGFVWLGIHGEKPLLVEVSSRIYLLFAIAFWPFWYSFAAWKMEVDPRKKSFLGFWMGMSLIWVLAYLMAIRGDAGVPIACESGHSVRYNYSDSGGLWKTGVSKWISRVVYLVTAILPVLVMTHRKLLLAPAIGASVTAFAAALYYDHAFTSVWCLWSALVSALIARSVWLAPAKAEDLYLKESKFRATGALCGSV